MTNDENRLRRPVMRRATETGCAGWAPIVRPAAADPAPVSGRAADESAATAGEDHRRPSAPTDLPRR